MSKRKSRYCSLSKQTFRVPFTEDSRFLVVPYMQSRDFIYMPTSVEEETSQGYLFSFPIYS
ncbi:hypothetical protein [Sigmofec virus UA08Rod_4411]|uniref:Uncharacterized protein n=1 Tax=Sigmofec virus UA08Rod_4411 TaxID=2929401 RepID=A0A976N1F4_9VIRU|nr:hypothetical protein [Sigmofec virus UA08Rod_4411]